MAEITICLPAWGEPYRTIASKLVLPAVMAALRKTSLSHEIFIYTDNEAPFIQPGVNVTFRPIPKLATPHDSLTAIHARTLIEAPVNSIVALLNADIIPSSELFLLGALVLSNQYRVVASFGLRVLYQIEGFQVTQRGLSSSFGGPPATSPTTSLFTVLWLPPGFPTMSAKELLDWGWKHRHPIVENCIWGRGKTAFPVTLFFVNGNANVVAHCSHLHPFLVRKEERDYSFRGTIDDGLLHLYKDHEVYYCTNRQVGFVELSPRDNPVAPHFMQTRAEEMDEDFVCEFGRNYLTTHCRNLRQGFRIIGDRWVYDTPALSIADRIGGNR